MNDLGYTLRLLRYERDITQIDAAKGIGISVTSLSYYENNKRKPRKEILEKLSNFYGVELEKYM